MTPKISVCIASYNHEKYVGETLRSVLSQEGPSFEVIVVDDCSTDKTAELISAIADERVHLHVNPVNLGPAGSLNRAFSLASGDYIAVFASDDMMYPTALAAKAAVLDADDDVGLVYSDAAIIDSDSRQYDTYWASEGYSPIRGKLSLSMLVSTGMFIPAVSVMVRRRDMADMDASLRYAHDGDLWLRIAAKAKLDYVDKPLVGWRQHENNLHRVPDPRNFAERSEVVARILQAHPWAAPRWARGALIANPLLQAVEPALRRSRREARECLARAFHACPYHPLLPLLYLNTFLDIPALWNLGAFKQMLLGLTKPKPGH